MVHTENQFKKPQQDVSEMSSRTKKEHMPHTWKTLETTFGSSDAINGL
jgi:hypothetical protein